MRLCFRVRSDFIAIKKDIDPFSPWICSDGEACLFYLAFHSA